MESTTRDGQQVQHWPEPVLHDFVAAGWPSISRDEQKAVRIRFPLSAVIEECLSKYLRQRNDPFTCFVFDGLNPPIPSGAANVQYAMIEVNILPLKAEHFAGAHPRQSKNQEHGLVRFTRCGNNFAQLLQCKESSFGLDFFSGKH